MQGSVVKRVGDQQTKAVEGSEDSGAAAEGGPET